jgi:hypothetical protein
MFILLINCENILFDDCNVENKKIGEEFLMPITNKLLNKFSEKTIVYVDEFGNEMEFIEQNGIQRTVKNSLIRINCNNGWGDVDKSHDYIKYEWISIQLINSVENLEIKYIGRMIDRLATIREPVYYDDLNSQMYILNSSCCSMSSLLVMSMRDNIHQPIISPDPQIISDTIILSKHFTNIYKVKKNPENLCCGYDQPEPNLPNELYISKTDGIIAFKQLNGKLWRFEREE